MSKQTMTIGDTARRGVSPKWYSDNNYAAHLMSDDNRTMCGYTISAPQEVPAWHKRCGNCKTKLRKLLDAVLEPSPAFVREKIMITVTRPVKENLEDLSDALRRKVRSNTTWTVELEHLETEIIQAEPEELQLHGGHLGTCDALFGAPFCTCGKDEREAAS